MPNDDLRIEQVSDDVNADAAIYARTSGADSKSHREQIDIARRRCQERGWRVRYILVDEGMSGGDHLRPGYQALWHHVHAGRIGVLVTWKIDRVARSLAEMAGLEEALREYAVSLHSCTEPIDTTTPHGRFIFGILATAGQLERELGSERVRSMLTERARRGMWMHPIPPFGYCLGAKRTLRLHPSESRQVQGIFQDFLKYGSYAEVAATRNHAGDRRRGRRWTSGTVQRVVCNTMHIGHYRHWNQAVTRPTIRIVDDDIWAKAVSIRRAKPRAGRPASDVLRTAAIKTVFDQYIRGLDYLDDEPFLPPPR